MLHASTNWFFSPVEAASALVQAAGGGKRLHHHHCLSHLKWLLRGCASCSHTAGIGCRRRLRRHLFPYHVYGKLGCIFTEQRHSWPVLWREGSVPSQGAHRLADRFSYSGMIQSLRETWPFLFVTYTKLWRMMGLLKFASANSFLLEKIYLQGSTPGLFWNASDCAKIQRMEKRQGNGLGF